MAWHHQVMRLVDKLSMLLHTNAMHVRARASRSRAFEGVLLLEVVSCGARLLRAVLAVRRGLHLHLEVGLGSGLPVSVQVVILQLVRHDLLGAALQTAVTLFAIGAPVTLIVIDDEDTLVAIDLRA